MQEKQLPKAQILLAIFFWLVVLLAPLSLRSFEAIMFLSAATGLALACITARIGWLILQQGKAAVYPFQGWSISLLNWMAGAKTGHRSELKQRSPSAASQKWLGIASLVCGLLGAVASAMAILFALTQITA
jgi:hypothetical protein